MSEEREAAREAARRAHDHQCDYPACGDRNFRSGFDAGADWQREQCGPPSLGRRDWYEQRIAKLESDLAIERGRVEGMRMTTNDAIRQFVERVNRRAERDIMAGRPVEGAHHRALHCELVLLECEQ